jgi:hypothetical protein
MRRNVMKKLIMMCAIIIGVAGTANAAPTLITFNEFPLGTAISNQYAPQGVIFSAATYNLPIISMNGAMPTQPILRPDGGPSTYAGDFWIKFTTPVLQVQFDSGYWDGVGTGLINVYNPAMNPLASLTNTGTGVQLISLTGLGPIGNIYFNSVADPAGADIDNLAFQPIPAPGAILLGSIGVGIVSWLRRRRTL